MTNANRAALAMVVIGGMEAWPLAAIAASRNGPAKLALLLGSSSFTIAPFAWALAGAVAVIYCAIALAGLPYVRTHLFDVTPLKALAVPFALITGAFEELFFRKWLMDFAAGHGGSIAVQIACSAVVFGLAHGVWGVFGRSVRAAVNATVITALLGGALACVYVLAGRQVAPAAWSHIAINVMIEPWLILAFLERGMPTTVVTPSQGCGVSG